MVLVENPVQHELKEPGTMTQTLQPVGSIKTSTAIKHCSTQIQTLKIINESMQAVSSSILEYTIINTILKSKNN